MDRHQIAELEQAIDRSSETPLYTQIEEKLADMIRNSTLASGDKIPSDVELAGLLDVGHMTVRRALSGLEHMGLIKRIRRAGTFVCYGSPKVMPSVGLFYFVEARRSRMRLAEHLQMRLHPHGYDLKIIPFEYDYYSEIDLCHEVQVRGLAAGIFVLMPYRECEHAFAKLEETGFPYIRLGNMFFEQDLRATLIRGNEIQANKDAINYLRGFGHEKIGLIACLQHDESEIVHTAMCSEVEGFRPEWYMSVEFVRDEEAWTRVPGRSELIREYLETNPELTAIVLEHPGVCVDLLEQSALMGKRIPQDLSIICTHDWDGLTAALPKVTAMSLSQRKVAEICTEKLLTAISRGIPDNQETVRIKYDLIERESVCPPAGICVPQEEHALIR